jgi:hypothetical protein
VGEVTDLGDPRFADAIANDGLWKPFDFLFRGRPGVYFLQAYDRKKIPGALRARHQRLADQFQGR